MKNTATALAYSFLLSIVTPVQAGTSVWFKPLTESASVNPPNAQTELSAPWITPDGIEQTNVISLREVENTVLSPQESIIRIPAGNASSMFDMTAYDDSGRYLFIPHETPFGAGVTRHDTLTNSTVILFQGDLKGSSSDWSHDYGSFDPCRFTPNRTLFLGEEWTGEGRIMEVLNPFADPQNIQVRELESIANVAHEGINFSKKDPKVIYYVDEWNSGSLYKFVMKHKGDYTSGQTFVLSVDDFLPSGGRPEAHWNEQPEGTVRTGPATWIPLTDSLGNPLPGITNPFRNGPSNDPRTHADTRGGRPAADDAGATPFGRPEDMEITRLRNGHEALYVATTSEASIYCIEILNSQKALVRVFANNETPKNLNFPATSGILNSPDNLAQDALGNIYVIEDAPNNSDTGGDIWFLRDVDNDGIAESLDHFLSIQVDGSEATGMVFNPKNPTEFVVTVQHPDSTNLAQIPNGFGDAIWKFDISNIENQEFVRQLNQTQNQQKAGRKAGRKKAPHQKG